jgi:uncharacterized protein HemX
MKTIAKLSVVAALGIGIYFYFTANTTEYVYQAEPAPVVEEVKPVDQVSEAQKQLNEAKRLLDSEETKILAEITEKEARLEEIREVRLSFSQAPGLAQ